MTPKPVPRRRIHIGHTITIQIPTDRIQLHQRRHLHQTITINVIIHPHRRNRRRLAPLTPRLQRTKRQTINRVDPRL
ncbi:MAG: hypothetical protein OXH86_10425, partial [Acidimicrobiaceae bacterium]|nr:hypothetical protein [Acidimicrobiaceae bacterium]